MATEDKEETKVAQETDDDEESNKTKKKTLKKKSRMVANPTTTSFKGKTAALKDHVFIYHQLHDKKWIKARQEFINYASRTYGGDEETSLEQRKLTIITMDEPKPPTTIELATMDDIQKEYARDDYRTDRKAYKDLLIKTKKNLSKLYAVLWGQCDPIMQNKMKATPQYERAHLNKSVIDLLSIIETVCEQGDSSRNRRVQRFISKKRVYNLRQGDEMNLGEYLEKFEALVNVAEKNGAIFYENEDIVDAMEEMNIKMPSNTTKPITTAIKTEAKPEDTKDQAPTEEAAGDADTSEETSAEVIKNARDRALAIIFFMNSNETKYAIYKQECHNAMTKGRDEYPKTVTEAHTQLEDYRFNPRLYQLRTGATHNKNRFSGHQFLVDGDLVDETPKRKQKEEYYCYNCGRKNECMAYDCPHKTKENGDPTRAERRKLRDAGEDADDGEQHLQEVVNDNDQQPESNESDEWELELEGDDYGIGFYMNGETDKDVLVEDLRGKNRHAFNQCKHRLNPKWILIDNCSSVNVFYNKRFLQDIRKADRALHLYTNAGKAIITMVGDLPGFGEVYYYPDGIANILSFHIVTNMPGYQVEYNNAIEDAFNVTNKNGESRKFVPSEKGLYYWDSTDAIRAATSFVETDVEQIAVATVKGNKAKYSKRDNDRANQVRSLQDVTNWGDRDMMRVAKYGSLLNNPFTPRDITLAKAILGPSVSGLQGKTARQKRKEVEVRLTPVPRQIMDHYHDITLSIDIMHVNGIPFLVTISKYIHYGTATPLPNMTEESMYAVLVSLDKFYKKRGFKVGLILADKQFECLDNEVAELEILMNIAAHDEHVPEVERYIRVIKERARSALSNTPFRKIPGRMVIGLIAGVLFYTNGIPWEQGVSRILSPMTIVTGRKLDYRLHCKVPFGAYAQIRRGTDNTMKERTFGAIAMGPMNNMQGGMTFMSLVSGRKVERDKADFIILPMPDEVITQVEAMGGRNPNGLIFGDDSDTIPQNDEELAENDQVEDMSDEESVASEMSDINKNVENTGVADDSDNIESTGVDSSTDGIDEQAIIDNQDEEIDFTGSDGEDDDSKDSEDLEGAELSEDSSIEGPRRSERTANRPVFRGFEDAFIHVLTDGQPEEPNGCQVVRTGIEQYNYNRALVFLNQASERCHDKVGHHLMTQYGLKAGLKKFGAKGQAATTKEMKQMLSREVFEEIPYSTLTSKDKELALPILLFLTKKRDGSIKGRACADGRKQRIWMQKEDTKSPTVSTEGLFYLLMMDAFEGRDVATLDLPGHFLQTPMEGRLILRVDGELATALIELDANRWGKHLQKIRGRSVIFVKCSKAIYGTLNAALLSYKKLIGHLTEWGFEMNPYDHCVWNKSINGKQMTVAFHVDDMKISHVDPNEVNNIIEKLRGIYGKTDPMTVNRGKVHEYLGMTIDYTKPKEVKITMYDYVQKMINDLRSDMVGTRATAAPDHLFHTSDGSRPLDTKTKDYFHTMTARALYLGKRGRPDLQTSVAFLSTRVREPDEHDYKKLGHLMKYLQETKHMPLILRYDGKEISLYIDGAHAVHGDMRGHVGVMVTGGGGTLYASSTKTKLNTVSSTETEIVAVGEKLPKHVWFRYFRIAQGGDSTEDILYQDNEAAILLENNGRMSCGKGSKHINIRYFFITDKIKKKEIMVRHCPTKEMIADYFTKPLQGGLFRKFRNLILGLREEDLEQYKQEYKEAIDRFGLNARTDDQG